MVEFAVKKLKRKHLLVVSGNEGKRRKFIEEVILLANLDFHCAPVGMKTIDEYVDFVRKEELFNAWYEVKGKHGSNQVLDFHRNWLLQNNSLIILPELSQFEERWKLDLLKSYITAIQDPYERNRRIHVIISQEEEDDFIQTLYNKYRVSENEKRSVEQIINGSIEVITLE